MKARILSLLLVLALLVTVSVFAVEAADFDPATTTTCPMCGDENVTWTEFACQNSSGHYYLADSYTMTKQVDLTANGIKMCLHLNGKTMTAKDGNRAFMLNKGTNANTPVLNLMGGTIQGGATRFKGNGGLFYLHDNGAELNIHEGTELKSTAAAAYADGGNGSVIYAGKGATVNMHGGTITGPTTNVSQGMNGGAVYVTGGAFNMYGGTINGNNSNKGGAISLFGGATFTMGYAADLQPVDYVTPTINGFNVSRNGGAVFMSGTNTKFTLNAGTINGATQTTGTGGTTYYEGGGNIFMQSAAAFEMNGGTIQGGTATASTAGYGGGAVCLRSGATFDMNDGTIQGTKSGHAGGSVLISDEGSTFNLNKGTIEVSTSSTARGGAVAVWNKGVLNVGQADSSSADQDAKIIFAADSAATDANGGLIFNSGTDSTVNLYKGAYLAGGIADGSRSETGGGAFYNTEGAVVNMYGGTITDCSSKYTGAINNNSTFNMSGGSIENGDAATYGGNVFHRSGTFTMEGGTISGGTATAGGNVYVAGGTFNLKSGSITGGTALVSAAEGETAAVYGNGGNVYNNATFTMTSGTISNGTTELNASWGGNVYNAKTFKMDGGTISGGRAKGPTDDASGGGGVYNAADAEFTMNSGAAISGGYGWIGGNIDNNGIFTVNSGATVTGGHAFYDAGGDNGGNIRTRGGTLTIAGGTVESGVCTTYGGNIMAQGGVVNITSGTIQNGSASIGANIFVLGSTVNISEDEGKKTQILGGTTKHATNNGGSISIRSGTVNFSGGTIDATETSCKASGAAVAVGWSNTGVPKFNMTGGTITGGSAAYGGNVCVWGAGQFNMTGGTISGGTATTAGGNVYVVAGTFKMTGGFIMKGYATGTATGYSATVGGGNVLVSGGSFTMSGESEILEGTAVHSGGNVKVNGGIFKMDNGQVSGGKNEFATNNGLVGGGNFNVVAGELDINGGTVSGGVAVNYTNGGNILVTGGTVNIDKATIQVTGETKAAANGPNIYVRKNSTVNLTIGEDAILTDEGYTQSGGGRNIYVYSGNVTIDGGEIRSYSGGSSILVDGNSSLTDAKLTVNGGTIINKGTTGAAGKSIYVNSGTLILNGGKLVNGMVNGTSVNMNAENTAMIAITLSGDAWVDQLAIPNAKDTQAPVTVAADFSGCAYLRPIDTEIYQAVSFGWSVTDNTKVTVDEAYANTGSLFVGALVNGKADYLPAAYSEGNLYITGLTKVVEGKMFDDKTDTVEVNKELPIVSADEVDDGEYLVVYNEANTIELTKSVMIDTKGKDITVNASEGVVVSLIDTTNDDFSGTGSLTLTGEGSVAAKTVADGKTYIVLKTSLSDNGYSAHRLEVKLTHVNLRPSSDDTGVNPGVYYKTMIQCDTTLAGFVENYGVVASLVQMPTETFMTDEAQGACYTLFDGEGFTGKGEVYGTMINGILVHGNDEASATRAETPINATAYVCIVGAGSGNEDLTILAEGVNFDLKTILEKVDAKVGSEVPSNLLALYEAYQNVMGAWMPNTKAAFEAPGLRR